ncbi:MFS transporter [Halalkalibacter krulwichiae]|uniref:Inner membrane transport protein YdhC n=1 Tax=Halalkalibacter krulwichiae TaxID=199441 RepID=A0A1X9M8V7_9BACI|nr:MFS transporter [Halalkalibacter krulwichiae]ARK29838.1 Inner membrane transport protein YdhC [Halalkalibacter krulwichiae]
MQTSKTPLWTKDFVIIWLSTFLLALMYFLTMTTITAYVIEHFGASQGTAGLAASLFIVGVLAARLFTGKYLDLIGRKKLLYTGLILSFLVSLFFFTIDSLNFLLLIRFVQGIVMGVAISVMQISVMNIIPVNRQGEGISYYSLSFILATAIGPFIGVYIMQMGNMSMIFIICTLLSILCILLPLFASIPNVEMTYKERNEMKGFQLTSFIDKRALPITAMTGLLALCYVGILSFLATYSMEINLMTAASYFFIVYSVCILVSRPFTGRLLDTRGDNVVMFPSFILFIVGLLVLSQAESGIALLIAGALIGLGFGNLQSATQAIAIKKVPQHRIGLATTTFWVCYDLGIGLGPFLLGMLIPFIGYRNLYVTLAIIVLACTGLYYLLHGKKNEFDKGVTQGV